MDKQTLLKQMTKKGYTRIQTLNMLDQIDDAELTRALTLIRDLRYKALQQRIHPLATRVALRFALFADYKAIKTRGFDPLFIDTLSGLITLDLAEKLT